MQNASLSPAQQALAEKAAAYADEVRRLLDAGLAIMRELGTTARPRVADIARAAGLSNDAFYRHFASKDALITALLEEGAVRLRDYLEHQMAKANTPEAQVRTWVRGVMGQADDEIATTTLAVLWNAGTVGEGLASGPNLGSSRLTPLLHAPFTALGSGNPQLDAALATHAVLGVLAEHLWQRTRPTKQELEHLSDFCLSAVSGGKQ